MTYKVLFLNPLKDYVDRLCKIGAGWIQRKGDGPESGRVGNVP